jgi:N-dimethylarginine dimethylaminohydrolase
MNINTAVDLKLAKQQWNILISKIKKCGGQIKLINGVSGYPDMVFTSNAALIYENNVILSNFYHTERIGETQFYHKYFLSQNYKIANEPYQSSHSFEGEAEVLMVNNNWFVAVGLRSKKEFYENHKFFKKANIHYCELVSEVFFHLDTCLLYLGNKIGLWYPKAFSLESQLNLSEHFDLHEIPYEEALKLACNAIVINNNVILPSGCPITEKLIKKLGYITHPVDMSEFLKSGGACNCLTLRIA